MMKLKGLLMNRRKRMEDIEKLREMSKILRESADALDETIAAAEEKDEGRAEDAMGKFIMRMLRLQALQDG